MQSNVQITGSVGRGGKNLPADVYKIEDLLCQIGFAPPSACFSPVLQPVPPTVRRELTASRSCALGTIEAIGSFQRLWGGVADGKVEAGGLTLGRMNGVAAELHLKPILNNDASKPVVSGGYRVSYEGALPPTGYQILLNIAGTSTGPTQGQKLGSPAKFLDVTKRPKHDLISWDNLPDVLRMIGEQRLWATRALVTLFVTRAGIVITRSNSEFMHCPVKPYSGNLRSFLEAFSAGTYAFGEESGTPPLLYTGKADGSGGGSFFFMPTIDGKFYFLTPVTCSDGDTHGRFACDNSRRGFDCITFVGAVLGVDPKTGAMSNTGKELAEHLKAESCNVENKTAAEIKKFFADHRSGLYIMWSGGHVVLVVDGVIHEFTFGGYKRTAIENWSSMKRYSVRMPHIDVRAQVSKVSL